MDNYSCNFLIYSVLSVILLNNTNLGNVSYQNIWVIVLHSSVLVCKYYDHI
jgi:hypothetical protein